MKKMKKFLRVLLLLACVVYLVLFVRDVESVLDYRLLTQIEPSPKTWFWLCFSGLMTLGSVVFATVYVFSKYLWKRRWALTVAMALAGIFVAFSEVAHVNEYFRALHPVVGIMAAAIYITCIFAVKVPHRRYIACGTLAAFLVSYCIVGGIADGVAAAFDWSLRYAGPLIPLGLLGLILPDQYD